jgi:hypothetical protein
MKFQEFNKIPRLTRDMVITEKIDGTNAQVYIADEVELEKQFEDAGIVDDVGDWLNQYTIFKTGDSAEALYLFAGSRTRWIEPHNDNHGFANWVQAHAEELIQLGKGHHYGEWWGPGIQRGYGTREKVYSLFNVSKWKDHNQEDTGDIVTMFNDKVIMCPSCCKVVPTLYTGPFDTAKVEQVLAELKEQGSHASPGFLRPEGVVIFHVAANRYFKKTLEKDEQPKGKTE